MQFLYKTWQQLVRWHGQHNQVTAQALQDNLARIPWVLAVVLALLLVGMSLAWWVDSSKTATESLMSNFVGWADLVMLLWVCAVLALLHWGPAWRHFARLAAKLPVFLAVLFIGFGITLSIASQWLLPSATMYVIGCVFVGALLLIRPSTMALIYGLSYVMYFVLLGNFNLSRTVQILLRFHGGLAAALGLTLSLVLWRRHTVTELLRRQVQAQSQALAAQNTALEAQKMLLESLSQHDALTGLLNRRAFEAQAEVALSRARRDGTPLAVLMFDLDHFKRVNDQYGHPAGDTVIRFMADVLRTSVRDTDLAARVGGEEFMLLLPATGEQAAAEVAEKIRARVAQTPVQLDASQSICLTVSAGVASFAAAHTGTFAALYAQADQALYQAKRLGRNRVAIS